MQVVQAVGTETEPAADTESELLPEAGQLPVYLDYNATSPLAPQVLAAMLPYFSGQYGNASSTHGYGRAARQAIELARTRVAALLQCQPDEIVFTGGGSESNNLAIKGTVCRRLPGATHLVTSVIDHPAVRNTCRYLASRFGTEVTWVGVDTYGMVSSDAVIAAIRPRTIAVSIMLANNEVGTIQPIGDIARAIREVSSDIVVHTDAAQAVGKTPVHVGKLDVDLLTVAAHKFCGPKGVGALYVRRGTHLDSLVHGSSHERNCRAGTENVPGIVGLGMACELARTTMDVEEARLRSLRDQLEHALRQAVPTTIVHGHPTNRLPNTLSISFPGVSGQALLAAAPGVAASTGSACHSGSADPSDVLIAMGIDRELAASTLRLSVGRFTTEHQIERAVAELVDAYELLSPV
jgi:cysteine desulfurase